MVDEFLEIECDRPVAYEAHMQMLPHKRKPEWAASAQLSRYPLPKSSRDNVNPFSSLVQVSSPTARFFDQNRAPFPCMFPSFAGSASPLNFVETYSHNVQYSPGFQITVRAVP
jgi:hypothetical protein